MRNIKRFLIVICILLVVVFLLITISNVRGIEVIGNIRYTDREVLDMLNIHVGDNILDVLYREDAQENEVSYIKDVNIRFIGLNRLQITVKEKEIIGYIPYMNKYICIDYEGTIIDYTNHIESNIPIIEGIEINDFTINERLDVDYKIIEAFVLFYYVKENYQMNIEYIRLENHSTEQIVLLIDGVKVIFGSTNMSSEKIKVLVEVMNNIEEGEHGTLDISGDLSKVIFKKNEDYTN